MRFYKVYSSELTWDRSRLGMPGTGSPSLKYPQPSSPKIQSVIKTKISNHLFYKIKDVEVFQNYGDQRYLTT